jgi:UMF1 family MFS transporter
VNNHTVATLEPTTSQEVPTPAQIAAADQNEAAQSALTKTNRRRVLSWAFYDWAMQPFNTVILTFVFTAMYLVSDRFVDQAIVAEQGLEAAQARLTSGLGLMTTIAGIAIALVAPVLGQMADASGKRKTWLAVATTLQLAAMASLFFVAADPRFFWLGASLVAVGGVLNTIAETNYNAMLVGVAEPSRIGRVSGLGWGLGYTAGVANLLLIAAASFVFDLGAPDGMIFRWIAIGCVVWGLAFAWPIFKNVPEARQSGGREFPGFFAAYGQLFRTVRKLYHTSRSTFWFLISSAIYRDGLSGVFAFGAVIAAVAFGFGPMEVLIFGIAANLVAGLSTFAAGRLDDAIGPRRVIIGSLSVLLVSGILVVALHGFGPIVFWVLGLLLCCTVGPAQSASRSFLARQIPAGHEAEMFALYATTGKAASFMAPAMWTASIALTGATIWGTLGIMAVVLVGLLLFVFLREPVVAAPMVEPVETMSVETTCP